MVKLTLIERMWMYHEQCEEARRKMTQENTETGLYSGQFWIYEEKRYVRWPEYIEFYRKQDEEEGISTRMVGDRTESTV